MATMEAKHVDICGPIRSIGCRGCQVRVNEDNNQGSGEAGSGN